jgi:PAS domain S-box-containing protein
VRVQRIAGVADDITERKHAEEDLKKSQNLLDESQRIAHIGSWDMDVKTGMILWTDEAFRVFGERPQAFQPTFDEFVARTHPEDRSMVLTHLGETQETKQFKNFEYRAKWPDETVRLIHNTGAVFCDEAGEVVRLIGTVQDITERKRAEEELNRSQKLLEGSQRIAHIGSWDMDVKTGALYLTDETYRIFGTQPQSFQSTFDDFISRIHPEDRGMVLTHLNVTQESKQFKNFEFRAKRPDGSVRWIQDTGEVICDEAGDLVRLIGTVQDVTERKQMEDALRQNEKRYRSIFETASVSLMEEDLSEVRSALDDLKSQGVVDFRRYLEEQPQFILQASRMIKVLDVNKETLKLYGAKDKEELLGSLNKIFVEESLLVFQNLLIALAEGRTDFQAEGINQTLQGERRHVLFRASTPDVEEDFSTLLVSIMDITDRKRAEDELHKYREHLEELVAERTRELEIAQKELLKRERLAVLGQLTATVSHELRNPLGTIRSSNFYLQRKVKGKDEKIDKHFSRIDDQVERCDSIVGDLLEYTRGRHVDAVEAAINPWLDDLLDQFLESENIKIIRHFPLELPLVTHDQEKMRRVIVNVIDNAIQAVKAKAQESKNRGG